MGNTNYTLYAKSLEEFYSCINEVVGRNTDDKHKNPILWFRGQEYEYYNLVPSLFRKTSFIPNSNMSYTNNHLREDYRYQHFMARNYNLLECAEPSSLIVWQEIMQHHFIKTRLMDWSESSQIALMFSLESFINSQTDMELMKRRKTASPCIWVLNPVQMNYRIYNQFITGDNSDYPLIENAFKGIEKNSTLKKTVKQLGEELKWAADVKINKENIYLRTSDPKDNEMNGIFSLSALEGLRKSYTGRELDAIRRFELNPFFYLLLRYYSDGVPVEFDKLPPLAIIHPYHSERIRAQKGAFTVFPYYLPTDKQKLIMEMDISINPISMEFMPLCQEFIFKIVITDPEKVSSELKVSGERRGNLYPEMQIFSQDIENGRN